MSAHPTVLRGLIRTLCLRLRAKGRRAWVRSAGRRQQPAPQTGEFLGVQGRLVQADAVELVRGGLVREVDHVHREA